MRRTPPAPRLAGFADSPPTHGGHAVECRQPGDGGEGKEMDSPLKWYKVLLTP